jgi:hypothetical protein
MSKYSITGVDLVFDTSEEAEIYIMEHYEDSYRTAEELCELCEKLIGAV